MSKAVLRSAKPYWVYLIIIGKKKIEVGKDYPKSKEWNKMVELYCSKDRRSFNRIPKEDREWMRKYLGKVALRFRCGGIMQPSSSLNLMVKASCVSEEDLIKYSNYKQLYGWRICDLIIYNKPKELGEFYTVCHKFDCDQCGNCPHLRVEPCSYPCDDSIDTWCSVDNCKPLTRPPQSWQYVEEMQE